MQAGTGEPGQQQEQHRHDDDVAEGLEREGRRAVERVAALGGVAEHLPEQREGPADQEAGDQRAHEDHRRVGEPPGEPGEGVPHDAERCQTEIDHDEPDRAEDHHGLDAPRRQPAGGVGRGGELRHRGADEADDRAVGGRHRDHAHGHPTQRLQGGDEPAEPAACGAGQRGQGAERGDVAGGERARDAGDEGEEDAGREALDGRLLGVVAEQRVGDVVADGPVHELG
ncbi:hypothetical protein ACSNN9_17895 [Micromonospora sp. URMC 107]|uniref:hypothetical protein n=1 Tax=Micromonospora sp. URMC 107 TaxID=3423418 RepID=UPI003F1B3422